MYVYISGVSRGLGLALAENYLRQGHRVVGIGRKNEISQERFSFLKCDLASWEEVENLNIELPENEEILLINNAGILGEVKPLSKQEKDSSRDVLQINAIAPIQLMRKFSRACESSNSRLTVVNISSGAGRRAIPSWANYCASKAALDLFSETFQLEEQELGKKTKIYSLAPGVIDTAMQQKIRSTDKSNFSAKDSFVDLYEQKKLKSPEETAEEIRLSLEKGLFTDTICRLS